MYYRFFDSINDNLKRNNKKFKAKIPLIKIINQNCLNVCYHTLNIDVSHTLYFSLKIRDRILINF